MKGDFSLAVHALVYLDHMQSFVSSEHLAENICTNPVRVRRAMSMLKKCNIVETKEGNEGGYHLIVDADKLSLKDIADATKTVFVSSSWRSGDMDKDCLISSGMADIMDSVYSGLNDECLNHLKNITVSQISKMIFSDKN